MKKVGLIVAILLIIAQFFRPEKNKGDATLVKAFLEDTQPPAPVKTILEETCFDCHSSDTRYPWYNAITPINYWLNDHITHGSKHLNFSKWEKYGLKRKDHKLEEIIEMVKEREMPLSSYTWTHGNANLSGEQIDQVITWAKQVRIKYAIEPKPVY